ncbi:MULTISPECIES: hypothetical protein [Crocosphaera]|uniref:Uncharacterized protein n=3 Tax=Crocosphaera watsonii TaxID=263511 RepID=T2K0C8_CROWT|nr:MULTISPECIES: hypothetical protein [Crocosphaera]EHJ12261.1 hypothetical protein CWATWH0003_3015 [Crocosphaera watsonii WH 0003]NQZ64408.1 hypothetical protein [Crocosphaera sp.]CCQ56181.1 hypothetical protein CWATWH0005_5062 [Crocosphaera watsonii WH 0005]CCQ70412.1 hypothetical protein CWATWH0402_1978 [Crocosphaera watsonii WH 0402]
MTADPNKLKKMIERVLADGRLSRQEDEDIKAAIAADNKVTEEEMKLYRELQQMVFKGELKMED